MIFAIIVAVVTDVQICFKTNENLLKIIGYVFLNEAALIY